MSEVDVKVQRERVRSIATILSAVILSVGVTYGLNQVGIGFSNRTDSGITVTGSSKVSAKADNAVWTLSIQESSPSVSTAVKKTEASALKVQAYLTNGGIPASAIELGAMSSYGIDEYSNGNMTGRTLAYRASRNVTVRSTDVQLVKKLSDGIGSLLQTGVNVSNYGPAFYVSTLSDLRPKLLADATVDAKERALSMTKAVGGSIGAVVSVRSGPIQVTAPDSVDVSAGGAYDTSTIDKTVSATVTVVFKSK